MCNKKPQYTPSLVEQSEKDSLDAVRHSHLFAARSCSIFILNWVSGCKWGALLHNHLMLNLETAVQDGKVMQDFELESLTTGGDHSQMVKAPPVVNDYGSKDCVNLPSSTAVSRVIQDGHHMKLNCLVTGLLFVEFFERCCL